MEKLSDHCINMLNALNEGVVILDTSARITYVNHQLCEILGYQAEELQGQDGLQVLKTHRTPLDEANFAAALRGELNPANYEIIDKAGQSKVVRFSPRVISDGQGASQGVVATLQDITRYASHQKALRENEQLLQAVLNSMSEGLVLYNKQGVMTFANNAFRHIIDTREDLLFDDSLHSLLSEADHADQARRMKARMEGVENNEPYELTFRRKDGHKVLTRVTPKSFFDDQGFQGGMALITDLSGTKKRRERLREREEHYRLLYENSPYGMILLDGGVIIEANRRAEEIIGHPRKVLLGKNPGDFSPVTQPDGSPSGERAQALIAQAFSGQTQSFEWCHLTAEDKIIYAKVTLIPIKVRGKQMIQALMEDFTEQHKAREAIESYTRKLRALTREMTRIEEQERRRIAINLHDHLSQFLAMAKIKIESAVMAMDPTKQEKHVQSALGFVEEAIENSRQLTYDLSPPILYEFGLVEALRWKLDTIKNQYQVRTRLIDRHTAGKLSEEYRITLYRAASELLTNAVKHAEATQLTITVQTDTERITLDMRDNGKGFDPAVVAEGALGSKKFGLFSIKERIEQMGGAFIIRSKLGKGAKFTLSLPAEEEA